MVDELKTKQVEDGKDTESGNAGSVGGLEDVWKEETTIMKGQSQVLIGYYNDLMGGGIPETLAEQLVVNLSNYLLQFSFSD